MSVFLHLEKFFEESLSMETDNKETETPCDGCAIIMGDDPCTVCRYRNAVVVVAIERRHNQYHLD